MYWSQELEAGKREMEIVYNFTQEFPEGVFERLSAQLQGQAELRLDWADTIYIEVSDAQILAKRYVSATTNNIEVSIQVSGVAITILCLYITHWHSWLLNYKRMSFITSGAELRVTFSNEVHGEASPDVDRNPIIYTRSSMERS